MKRSFSVLALPILLCCFSTALQAQTRTSQLVITNSTGTTKFSQINGGMLIDNYVILQRPGNTNSTVTLVPPAGNGTLNFDFPSTSGTLLTSASMVSSANTFTGTQIFPTTEAQGDALINSINAGTLTIDAARLNVAAGGVSLAGTNTWTGVQTFPTLGLTGIAQGNALIASINAGNTALTGYATTSALATAIANVNSSLDGYTTDAELATTNSNVTTLTTNLATTNSNVTTLTNRTISTSAPLAGGGDLSANRTLSLNMNSTLALDGSNNLGLNLANNNTWTGTQTFPTSLAQGNALIASINAGNTTLSALSNYSTTTQMNTAITNATNVSNLSSTILLESDLAVGASLTKTGTGTVTLALNPANANTWTATQTFGNVNVTGTMQVTAATGKTAVLSAASISDNTTRTYTLPNSSGTIALADGSQNLIASALKVKCRTVTATTTMDADDFFVLATMPAGQTVTLPPASGNSGRFVYVQRFGGSAFTLAASGTDTIDGSASTNMNPDLSGRYLLCDGVSRWYVVSSR
jgi:trimeric autotransporter adhesin